MKKSSIVMRRTAALALSTVLAFSGAEMNTINAAKKTKVTKITVTNSNVKKKTLTIKKGKKVKLKVKVTPQKATNKKVSFKTSNKKIVSVTSKGVVKGIKTGKAKVTITAKDGSKKKYVLTVKVTKSTTSPTTSPTTNPTTNPTTSPATNPTTSPTTNPTAGNVKIDGKSVVIKNINTINNSDFTITVQAELEDGTKLKSLIPETVKNALKDTSLCLKNEKTGTSFTAAYQGYSNDNDIITFKISEQGRTYLQPSKNNADIGSADGRYLVTSDNFTIKENNYVSYNEALVGNNLSGYIYDKATKLPLKNVNVTAYTADTSKTVTTNEDGYYTLPLTSATYSVKAEAADTSKYFSAKENGKISTNDKTACNMFIESYNREELFLNGIIKSSETNEPLENAIVTLYKINADKSEDKLGTIKTNSSGLYIFGNSQAEKTSTYKELLSANSIKSSDVSAISKKFSYKEGLNRGETYKIVVSKELSSKNLTDVYETATIENISFDSSQQCNLNATVMKAVPKTKNMKMNIKWSCKLPQLSADNQKSVKVSFCSKNKNGYYAPIVSKDVTLKIDSAAKMSDEYDLAGKNFFASNYPTLPSGKYYIIIDDENKDESAITIQEVNVEAGTTCTIPTIDITSAKSTSVTTKCSVLNKESVSKFVSGADVYVVGDTKGRLKTTTSTDGKIETISIKPKYGFYQAAGEDLVYISSKTANLKFTKGSPSKIEATTGLARTAEGKTYMLLPVQSYIKGEKSLSFTQNNQAITGTTYNCMGAANIDSVKINAYSLLKTEDGNSLDANSVVGVEYVQLMDEAGTVLATYDCAGKQYKLSELKSTGVVIPATETGFKGLQPTDLTNGTGKYKVTLKLKDYDAVTTTISVTDFQSVTVNQTDNINYTQRTSLVGSLSIANAAELGDIQDADVKTIDAVLMLYDKDNKVVGAMTYGDKEKDGQLLRKYSFVNGENAYLEGGEYTLVVRGTHHNDVRSFETYIKKVTIDPSKKNEFNIELLPGSNGSVTLSIMDENNNYLENGNVTLYDEKHLDLSTFQYVPNCGIYETLSDLDPTLLGIYKINLAKESKNEWIATECIPKGTYTPVVTSDRTVTKELDKITLSSGQHYVSTGLQMPLIAGKDEIKLSIKYAHQLEVSKKSPFEMISVYNSKGEVVAQKAVFDTLSNKEGNELSYNSKDVYIPNVADTYTVVIYSNGSFLSKAQVTVQGTSKNVEIKLEKSSIN